MNAAERIAARAAELAQQHPLLKVDLERPVSTRRLTPEQSLALIENRHGPAIDVLGTL